MNYLNKEDIPEGVTVYEKFCKYSKCERDFWSTSKNTKYCCPDCADKAAGRIRKRNKVRRQKRKLYEENREINMALSNAYALAHKVAVIFKIPKRCSCTEEGHVCKGPLQLHHKNLNPFDNRPQNLEWDCASWHKSLHDKLGDVNMVTTYNDSIDYAGFEEEDEKYLKMIEYVDKVISSALSKK